MGNRRYWRLCRKALRLQQRSERLQMQVERVKRAAASEAKWSRIALTVPR